MLLEQRIYMDYREPEFLKALSVLAQFHMHNCNFIVVNGVMDLVHAAHARLFQEARRLPVQLSRTDCDCYAPVYTIAALNSDASTRRLKGRGRPYRPLADRLELVRAFREVDFAVGFDEDTPVELLARINTIKPVRWLVKGADYQGTEVPGANLVGSMHFVKVLSDSIHSTDLEERVLQAHRRQDQAAY